MYGMIHLGIRQMVVETLGPDLWAELEREIGIGPEELISLNVYDDAMTSRILTAAAGKTGQTLPEYLQHYGRYWIRFAERGSYGAIMTFIGSDIANFVSNLDRMHQAVLAAMPEARVPSFRVIEHGPGMLRIGYISEREGLEPFVVGLLEGMLERFELRGEVGQVPSLSNASEFLVTYEPA